MKKLLTIFMSLALILTMSGAVVADSVEITQDDLTEEGTYPADVAYYASSTNTISETNGDGVAQDEETWVITVPALSAGAVNADVSITGSFSPSKTLKVTAPPTVTLYLDGIETNDYAVLNVFFDGLTLTGSYTEASVTASAPISIQDMSSIKFGTWTGTLPLTVEVVQTEGWVASDVLQTITGDLKE